MGETSSVYLVCPNGHREYRLERHGLVCNVRMKDGYCQGIMSLQGEPPRYADPLPLAGQKAKATS